MKPVSYTPLVDIDTVAARIEFLGSIGRGPENELLREVYTPAWRQALDSVETMMREIGLETRLDAAGNLYGRLEGQTSGDAILVGSHIDTVPNAGKYDGTVGILGALEAVRLLKETLGIPVQTIEILVTCDEDGARFATDYWGSQAIAGSITPGDLTRISDRDGTAIGEAMRSAGFPPEEVGRARRDDVSCWLELHIEQGRVLEEEEIEIGLVTALAGRWSGNVRVTGREDHAGTTPMDMRRDAMAGAARMIADGIGRAEARKRPTVFTVGQIALRPGATNVIPNEVRFSFDVRDTDGDRLIELASEWDAAVRHTASSNGLSVSLEDVVHRAPNAMAEPMIAMAEDAAASEGATYRRMPSMASHDARILSSRWPCAMIFVPSRDGRSHCPEEFTSNEHIRTGIGVLASTLAKLAYE